MDSYYATKKKKKGRDSLGALLGLLNPSTTQQRKRWSEKTTFILSIFIPENFTKCGKDTFCLF